MTTESLFPTILASTVHDIKTSLGTLQELIHNLAAHQNPEQTEDIQQLEFEANRINNSLMQLLVMYKIDSRKFSLMVDEYPAIDIINEAKAQQERLFQDGSQEIKIECDEDLLCFCDFQQVSNALGNILNNAYRYMRSTIIVSARQQGDYLQFCIEDDGNGYPEHLLNTDFSNPTALDWVKGNTGLGLYFAAAIAGFHKNRQLNGYVEIDNDSSLGGARFSLFLP